jgi:hypothetical protein
MKCKTCDGNIIYEEVCELTERYEFEIKDGTLYIQSDTCEELRDHNRGNLVCEECGKIPEEAKKLEVEWK